MCLSSSLMLNGLKFSYLCNFSERSKRRVEVAYQAIDDDHADQIAQVGERAFEEILREVSLI